MNRVYEIDEGRPFIKLRGTMLAVTIATVLIVCVLAAMLVLSGPVAESVGNAIGLGGAFLTVWNIAQVAGHRGARDPRDRDPLLRHPEREAAQVPLDEPGIRASPW